jgi:hypothetical protein
LTARPEDLVLRVIVYLPALLRAIIIAPVRAVSKLVRTLPVQMLCPERLGGVEVKRVLRV